MADYYNFLVAHSVAGERLDFVKNYSAFEQWMQRVGGKIERCGGKNGRVIKFSREKYLKEISEGKIDVIELYSERIWEKGEGSETLNCNFSSVVSADEGLVLTAFSEKLNLESLVESFLVCPDWYADFDYAYAYTESHAFGFGYAFGRYVPDENHPLMWPRRSETIMWLKMQWSGKTDEYIRDVYPVNLFSTRKLQALPPEKLEMLSLVMSELGEALDKSGFKLWVLSDADRERARSKLADGHLLASCMV
ncbi:MULTISPECIES: hypothetical protein [Pseudomonas]|uniref:hypothetical protein n=1 Tax=Pseudomonas TaxID=286 RepID=UPI0016493635|nr:MULTISPECIES: hypothetical protein [Pseudomonas]QXI46006.1 hypothetical protein HU763_014595 [Pseudomonas anuradhapurensis]